jgi:hypothetical protein
MLARFQIRVIEYPKGRYEVVEDWLLELVAAVRSRTQRPFGWSFCAVQGRPGNAGANAPTLEIERSFLPFEHGPHECVAVPGIAAGGRLEFTPGIERRMRAWRVDARRAKVIHHRVHAIDGTRVFVLSTAANVGANRLTDVYDGAMALFRATGQRFATIHLQLVARRVEEAAAERSGEAAKSKGPAFPARFVLIQTVRAWRDWRARHPTSRCKLVLHVLAESVTMEIAAGRLDVLELLSCEDVRFSTEIVRDDHTIERRVFEQPPRTTKLAAIAKQLDLAARQWTLEVSPRPSLHRSFRAKRRIDSCAERTLHELGVVPGSTLHFRRR